MRYFISFMKVSQRTCLLILLLGLPISVGCHRPGYRDDRELRVLSVAQAYELLEQQEFDSARVMLEQVLKQDPSLVRPHLELAQIYHDLEQDAIRALYHYHRYLEFRPDTEKNSMIYERIRQAERMFVKQRTTVDVMDGRSLHALLADYQSLEEQVTSLREQLATIEAENASLREAERQRIRAGVLQGNP